MLTMQAERNQIKTLLQERGKTMYWLANSVGMSYQAIHGLANSAEIPNGTAYGTLRKISRALDVSIDDLETDDIPPYITA